MPNPSLVSVGATGCHAECDRAVARLVERRSGVAQVTGVGPSDQREAAIAVQQPVDAGIDRPARCAAPAATGASRPGTGSRARRRARPARSSDQGGRRQGAAPCRRSGHRTPAAIRRPAAQSRAHAGASAGSAPAIVRRSRSKVWPWKAPKARSRRPGSVCKRQTCRIGERTRGVERACQIAGIDRIEPAHRRVPGTAAAPACDRCRSDRCRAGPGSGCRRSTPSRRGGSPAPGSPRCMTQTPQTMSSPAACERFIISTSGQTRWRRLTASRRCGASASPSVSTSDCWRGRFVLCHRGLEARDRRRQVGRLEDALRGRLAAEQPHHLVAVGLQHDHVAGGFGLELVHHRVSAPESSGPSL